MPYNTRVEQAKQSPSDVTLVWPSANSWTQPTSELFCHMRLSITRVSAVVTSEDFFSLALDEVTETRISMHLV